MVASGRYLPSNPIMASCGSEEPTVRVPATARYSMAWPPTLTEPSVMESAGASGVFLASGLPSDLATDGAALFCADAKEAATRPIVRAANQRLQARCCIVGNDLLG